MLKFVLKSKNMVKVGYKGGSWMVVVVQWLEEVDVPVVGIEWCKFFAEVEEFMGDVLSFANVNLMGKF